VETAPVNVLRRLEPEDEARAQFYALLARLFARGPDAALLASIGRSNPWPAAPGNLLLPEAWNRLILASTAMDADAAEQEYTDLFIGVGRSNVDLHTSHYITEATSERPLVAVRRDLARLGLGRRDRSTLYEDHLSALCETMRLLVAGEGEREPAALAAQREFFQRRIAPWVFDCCDAICKWPLANYYQRVGEFTSLFMAVERDSLAID
jgi:TorA maturation chaperone TorD